MVRSNHIFREVLCVRVSICESRLWCMLKSEYIYARLSVSTLPHGCTRGKLHAETQVQTDHFRKEARAWLSAAGIYATAGGGGGVITLNDAGNGHANPLPLPPSTLVTAILIVRLLSFDTSVWVVRACYYVTSVWKGFSKLLLSCQLCISSQMTANTFYQMKLHWLLLFLYEVLVNLLQNGVQISPLFMKNVSVTRH